MYECNNDYRQRLAQAHRVVGELEALRALHYEPSDIGGGELYKSVDDIFDEIIRMIRDNFC